MSDDQRIAAYQLEIVARELEDSKTHGFLANRPDVERLLSNKCCRYLTLKLQELIWTVGRFSSRKRDLSAIAPAPSGPSSASGLYLDVSALRRGATRGGIKRLSREIVKHAAETGLATPTYVEDGRLMPMAGPGAAPITFARGDVFVIVSFFWNPFEEYKAVIAAAKAAGARVAVFVHDVIPALYGGLMLRKFHADFTSMLLEIVDRVDMVITLSRASAESLTAFLASAGKANADRPVRWFPMGSDAVKKDAPPKASDRGASIFDRPTFLTVGTLVPHKGVPVALSAFEQCWSRGFDINYLVVGQTDEYWPSIGRRITNHAEYGRRLFWFDDFDDGELASAYQRCHCYIQPSVDEGFGIPLVEAASHGKGIIASDIPVFREIGSDEIFYFARCDASDLADKIAYACTHPLPVARIALQDWRQSFLQLISLLRELQGGTLGP